MRCLPLSAALLALASCKSAPPAASPSELLVTSEPPGASYWTDAGHSGTTPDRIAVDASRPVVVTYVLAGYESVRLVVEPVRPAPRVESGFARVTHPQPEEDGLPEHSSSLGFHVGIRRAEDPQPRREAFVELLPLPHPAPPPPR